MKQFITWLGKRIINASITGLLLILGVVGISYAAGYPSTPTGETTGGKFATIFNNMLQSGNYLIDTTGKVKLATQADNSHTTDQVGTVTEGKWCKIVSGKIECTLDAPSTTPVAPPGTVTYGRIAWQTTEVGPMAHLYAVQYCNNLAPVGTWRLPTLSEFSDAAVLGMPTTLPGYYFTSFFHTSTVYRYQGLHNIYGGGWGDSSYYLNGNLACSDTDTAICYDTISGNQTFSPPWRPLYARCVTEL